MVSNVQAASAMFLKCFNEGGDCSIVVKHCSSAGEANSSGEAAAKRHCHVAEFRVYSALLSAWSDVFKAMFTHDVKEKSERKIEICDFSVAAVDAFLRFMYSGNLDTGAGILVEVAGLADKYCIVQLQELCMQSFKKTLKPETACEMLEAARQIGSSSIEEQCLEAIFCNPDKALPGAFALSAVLLEEVLVSPKLCIGDVQLAMLILGWSKHPVAKAHGMDIPAYFQRHVHVAGFTENEYSKVLSLADEVGCKPTLEVLWRQVKRGQHTTNLFDCLWNNYKTQFPDNGAEKPPFVGYWVNMIPSRASIGKVTNSGHTHLSMQQDQARGTSSIELETNDEMKWMIPHHAIYISAISFNRVLGSGSRIELFSSEDGSAWELLLDSGICLDSNVKLNDIQCRSKGWAKWFKLCVRKGKYNNVLKIQGILQAM
ncbi:unnamed protein product [Polarella glacialis]|uniref:BTB domain-containing protein n=1 Tax=Polarella glacialis TaxID=89957 RepID=A0A813K851_POLGL|nr:unnamed protein product [Polarella glacialis]